MLDTDQVVPCVDIWNVLRTSVLHGWDGCAASNLIQSASIFVGYLPKEQAPKLVQWTSSFAQLPVNGAGLNVIQLSTASEEQFAH